MKTYALIILIVTSTLFTQCKTDEITRIEFKTSTRGYSKTITLSKDSVSIFAQSRTDQTMNKDIKRKITAQEWSNLLNSIKQFKLEDLTNLPSPTSDRNTDKETASNIIVTASGKTYESGGFDGYNPNEKLSNLVKEIQNIENASK